MTRLPHAALAAQFAAGGWSVNAMVQPPTDGKERMRAQSFTIPRFLALRLDPGDDVLLALRAAVQEEGIENAAILAGVGSLDSYHFHVVKTTRMPPGNTFVQGEGPFDILTVTGLVLNGRVHAHITFSNTETAMGGHLEEGCRVLTFAVILLAETDGADFTDWDTPGPL
jgi:predicted DNA-binding protein with PD1-like motif